MIQPDSQAGIVFALRYLRRRDRTEFEVEQHLLNLELTPHEISPVIAQLRAWKFLSDHRIAQASADQASRRLEGPDAVRHRLESRGVPHELIEEVLQDIEDPETQLNLARELFDKKRLATKTKAQAYGALARRGFSEETISTIIESNFPDDGIF